MNEIWKDVVGYEGYYQVSNLGNIKALERQIRKGDIIQTRKEKIKTLTKSPDGYLTVKLSKDGKDTRYQVSRIVAEAFIARPESDEYLEVNHKDFNRENNHVDNLEWLTHTDNVRYSNAVGRHVSLKGKNNPNYGNHKLAEYFKEHPEEKIKLGRPGKQNGRCVPVCVVLRNGEEKFFDYLHEAAKFLIDNRLVKVRHLTSLANKISYCIKNNQEYKGLRFYKR